MESQWRLQKRSMYSHILAFISFIEMTCLTTLEKLNIFVRAFFLTQEGPVPNTISSGITFRCL